MGRSSDSERERKKRVLKEAHKKEDKKKVRYSDGWNSGSNCKFL